MQGNQLAAAIRRVKGKISVQTHTPKDSPWIFVQKSDLAAWAKAYGDAETGMRLSQEINSASGYYLNEE